MASRTELPPGILFARMKPNVDFNKYPLPVQTFYLEFQIKKRPLFDVIDAVYKKMISSTEDSTVKDIDGTAYVGTLYHLVKSLWRSTFYNIINLNVIAPRFQKASGGEPITFLTLYIYCDKNESYNTCTRAWIEEDSLTRFREKIVSWKTGPLLILLAMGDDLESHAMSLCFKGPGQRGTLIDSNEERSPTILSVLKAELATHNLFVEFDTKYEVPRQTHDPMCATWSLCASFLTLSGFSSDETYKFLVDLRYTALLALSRLLLKGNDVLPVFEDGIKPKVTPFCVLFGFPTFKHMPDNFRFMPDKFMYGDRALGFRGAITLSYLYWWLKITEVTDKKIDIFFSKDSTVARLRQRLEDPAQLRSDLRKKGDKAMWKTFACNVDEVHEALDMSPEAEVSDFIATFGTKADFDLALGTFVPDPKEAATTFEQKVLRLPPNFLLTMFAARKQMQDLYEPLDYTKPPSIIVSSFPIEAPQSGYGYVASDKTVRTAVVPDGETRIGVHAFDKCTYLTSVTIPESVTSIGGYAFANCQFLSTVTLPGSVTWIGNNAFASCSSLTSINIPATITSINKKVFFECENLTTVTIPENVTSIGTKAFMRCTFTHITIPASVTSIGEAAFGECKFLTEVTISEGVKEIGTLAFCDCAMTEIKIPATVTHIGIEAFWKCGIMKKVTLQNGVKEIGNGAFSESGLTEVDIPATVTEISDSAFEECEQLTSVVIPDSVESIGAKAFRHCKELKKIKIPEGVEFISFETFRGCDHLEKVVLPTTLTYIGVSAFSGCSCLKEVKIPEGVTHIEGYAFRDCKELTSIIIPDTVEKISYAAFRNCAITEVEIPKGVTHIGDGAFQGCITMEKVTLHEGLKEIRHGAFYKSGLTEVEIPEGVTKIPDNVFAECDQLTSVVIPDSVDSIGMQAFLHCTKLKEVEIPEGVTHIFNSTFLGCAHLEKVALPATLTHIDKGAFALCSSLKEVEIPEGVAHIGDQAFFKCVSLTTIEIPHNLDIESGAVLEGCPNVSVVRRRSPVDEGGGTVVQSVDSIADTDELRNLKRRSDAPAERRVMAKMEQQRTTAVEPPP